MSEPVSKTRVHSEKDTFLDKPLGSWLESGNLPGEGFYPQKKRYQSPCKFGTATKEGDSGLIDWSVYQKDVGAGALET